MRVRIFRSLLTVGVMVSVWGLASCSSGDDGGGSCENIAGTWEISGACGPDVCVVTQTSCDTQFSCANGTVAYSGSVSGNSVSFAGKTAAGVDGTCAGTLSGSTITGTCTVAGSTCSYTATRK